VEKKGGGKRKKYMGKKIMQTMVPSQADPKTETSWESNRQGLETVDFFPVKKGGVVRKRGGVSGKKKKLRMTLSWKH